MKASIPLAVFLLLPLTWLHSQSPLADESSPFLSRHADNVVAWRTWGDKAWEEARSSGKPVLLSLGYSTCHWCHVMEEETYSDPEWGARINAQFIPVLVDRDERPDLDAQYQTVALALTGHTGWPLHVVLTPEGQPFAAFQYVPPVSGPGLPGWDRILPGLASLWKDRRPELAASGQSLLKSIAQFSDLPPGTEGDPGEDRSRAVAKWKAAFDPVYGGFETAPKFPRFETVRALLEQGRRGDAQSLSQALQTVEALPTGGLEDHIGGGFHRYAVDRAWKEPHFEKTLQDQALALRLFAEAWKAGAGPEALETVRRTADFVLETLTTPGGWFAAGVDAGGSQTEGRYYRWTEAELVRLWGTEGVAAARVLGLPTDGSPGLVGDGGGDPRAQGWLKALKAERAHRLSPAVDTTLLTDANGWAIGGLAHAYSVTGDLRYLRAAQAAADKVLTLRAQDGRLGHVYRGSGTETWIEGSLDDYAALIGGLTEIYQQGFRVSDLQAASELAALVVEDFARPEGGFYQNRTVPGPGLSRTSLWADQPNPSGNGVALGALATLARLTGETRWSRAATGIVAAVPSLWRQESDQTPTLLNAAALLQVGREIVLAGTPGAPDFEALRQVVARLSRPGHVVLARTPGDTALDEIAPFSRGYLALGGRATAYVCESFVCQLPVTTPQELAALLTS